MGRELPKSVNYRGTGGLINLIGHSKTNIRSNRYQFPDIPFSLNKFSEVWEAQGMTHPPVSFLIRPDWHLYFFKKKATYLHTYVCGNHTFSKSISFQSFFQNVWFWNKYDDWKSTELYRFMYWAEGFSYNPFSQSEVLPEI